MMKTIINFNICRFCEKQFFIDKVSDHCHLTSSYRGPDLKKCNINVTLKQCDLYQWLFTISVTMIVI